MRYPLEHIKSPGTSASLVAAVNVPRITLEFALGAKIRGKARQGNSFLLQTDLVIDVAASEKMEAFHKRQLLAFDDNILKVLNRTFDVIDRLELAIL
jgi:hypothetical protein